MKTIKVFCLIFLSIFFTTTVFAESADHVVCSFSERMNEKPFLKEVSVIYFKKGGYQHTTVFKYLNKKTHFIVIERPEGISRIFIQTDLKTLLTFESAAPAPFVGDYTSPTISISSENLYLMCRELDQKAIIEDFPNALLVK